MVDSSMTCLSRRPGLFSSCQGGISPQMSPTPHPRSTHLGSMGIITATQLPGRLSLLLHPPLGPPSSPVSGFFSSHSLWLPPSRLVVVGLSVLFAFSPDCVHSCWGALSLRCCFLQSVTCVRLAVISLVWNLNTPSGSPPLPRVDRSRGSLLFSQAAPRGLSSCAGGVGGSCPVFTVVSLSTHCLPPVHASGPPCPYLSPCPFPLGTNAPLRTH